MSNDNIQTFYDLYSDKTTRDKGIKKYGKSEGGLHNFSHEIYGNFPCKTGVSQCSINKINKRILRDMQKKNSWANLLQKVYMQEKLPMEFTSSTPQTITPSTSSTLTTTTTFANTEPTTPSTSTIDASLILTTPSTSSMYSFNLTPSVGSAASIFDNPHPGCSRNLAVREPTSTPNRNQVNIL